MANEPNKERVIGMLHPMQGKPLMFWHYNEKESMQPIHLTKEAYEEAKKIVKEDQDKPMFYFDDETAADSWTNAKPVQTDEFIHPNLPKEENK